MAGAPGAADSARQGAALLPLPGTPPVPPRRAAAAWAAPWWRRGRGRDTQQQQPPPPPAYPARPERFALGAARFTDHYAWLRLPRHAPEVQAALAAEAAHYRGAAAGWAGLRRQLLTDLRVHVVSGELLYAHNVV